MAFKIIPKIDPNAILDRSLDVSFLGKYYKQLQESLIKKTNAETQTDYFFCEEFSSGEDLLVMGDQTMAYQKVFRSAGKGLDGFDKTKVSIGTCFILEEKGEKILCIQANPTLGKGKKQNVLKALKKLKKAYMKQIAEIRWLKDPVMGDAEDDDELVSVEDKPKNATDSKNTAADAPVISEDEMVKRTKDLQKGIEMLKKDIMPRVKNKETTERDVAFITALRKAGHLFLTKLAQTEPTVSKKFAAQKDLLEDGLPQWKELEEKIINQKGKLDANETLKKSLQDVVNKMNDTRKEINEILKRVNLKSM